MARSRCLVASAGLLAGSAAEETRVHLYPDRRDRRAASARSALANRASPASLWIVRTSLGEDLRASLGFAQLLAAATLLRSVAYERWITVLAAALLLVGTLGAQRGRTSGVALCFVVAGWFGFAGLLGIGPAWFVGVGLAAAMPFLQLWRSFVRFDRGASVVLAGLATTFGLGAAIAWKSVAWLVFTTFPSLSPSRVFENGAVVTAMLVAMVGVEGVRRRRERADAQASPLTEVGPRLERAPKRIEETRALDRDAELDEASAQVRTVRS